MTPVELLAAIGAPALTWAALFTGLALTHHRDTHPRGRHLA